MLNESDQMILITPDNPWNPRNIAYSEIKDSILDFEGNLVDKRIDSE